MTGQTICVAAVDEHEAARYGLQRWLSAADDSIVVTGSAACAARVIRAAAHGDALVPLPVVRELVRELAAVATEVRLSPQEVAATTLYAAGMPLASVARRMQLSPQTVKQYVDRARAKYRSVGRPCPTKVHLYQRLVEDGLVDA